MKFGVIEYTSKNGQVWRHTAERPNYLANPQTELDPTSFGCYVSALAGEHIPLAGLIIGPVAPVTPVTRLSRRIFQKLTGRFPQTYSLDYFKDFDAVMIVHQIASGPEITAFTKRLKATYPHIFIMGVPTHAYGMLAAHWQQHPAWLTDFKEFMAACDVFITIVEATKPDWKKLTTTPVVYLPQPYPVEYTEQFFTPLVEKQPIIFVAGVTDRDNIRQGQLVAAALQKLFPDHIIQMTDIPGTPLDLTNLQGARYELVPFKHWREHLEQLRYVKLVINTDFTFTRGRVQVDCAAVGTPSLGANSDGQLDFWPELAATPTTTIEELVRLGEKLWRDDQYYTELAQRARQELEKYSYQAAAQRIQELHQTYGR